MTAIFPAKSFMGDRAFPLPLELSAVSSFVHPVVQGCAGAPASSPAGRADSLGRYAGALGSLCSDLISAQKTRLIAGIFFETAA
jgi:hypothetical protein